jgi:hypothetical protein
MERGSSNCAGNFAVASALWQDCDSRRGEIAVFFFFFFFFFFF